MYCLINNELARNSMSNYKKWDISQKRKILPFCNKQHLLCFSPNWEVIELTIPGCPENDRWLDWEYEESRSPFVLKRGGMAHSSWIWFSFTHLFQSLSSSGWHQPTDSIVSFLNVSDSYCRSQVEQPFLHSFVNLVISSLWPQKHRWYGKESVGVWFWFGPFFC